MARDLNPSTSPFSSYAWLGDDIYTVPEPRDNGTGTQGKTRPSSPRLPRYGSGSVKGQAAPKKSSVCKYFPAGWLLPVALELRFGVSVNGGSGASAALNQPTQLLHAQDAEFAGCWFSNAIDLGDDSRTPPFWLLRKTAKDTWLLRLCRGKGELAAYRAKTRIRQRFPLKLKKIRSNRAFNDWPSTITIRE
jgi:hypothetical protein